MRIDYVDIGQLESGKGCFRAFNEVLPAKAKVVDLVAGRWKCGIVGTPVDLLMSEQLAKRHYNES